MKDKTFLKVALLFIISLLAIATNSEIFNMHSKGLTDSFHLIAAGVNFAAEAYLIYHYAKDYLFSAKK